jgi:hypothetical protein
MNETRQVLAISTRRCFRAKPISSFWFSPESDQTPAFGQMAGQLFGQANPNQQAGMLNQMLSSMGPSVLASLAAGAGGGALSGILGRLTQGGAMPAAVTPEQASQLTPEQVQAIATHAE